jgi:hypothetical protein
LPLRLWASTFFSLSDWAYCGSKKDAPQMSKSDPHVRELLRKNQFAEALRYYRTRYQADRADAMRILQEIQSELSGKPPAGGLVTASGAGLASSQPTPQPTPPQPKLAPVVHVSASPEPPRPAPEPPKPAAPVVSFQSKEVPTLKNDHRWEALSTSSKRELQQLLEEGRALDAIRTYWHEYESDLRLAKEHVLRWSAVFPLKL